MDTITHALLGAVTAQLGFRQRIGREAAWVAAAVAVVPDLDLFITPLLSLSGAEHNEFTTLSVHRGLSHSLLLTPVLAFLIAIFWLRFKKIPNTEKVPDKKLSSPPSFWLLYFCVFVPMLFAPLLDVFTSYGTQLLAPFSNRRFAIDAIPIVDIIYTPILISTLLACFLVRKFKPNPNHATLIIGWSGFLMSCLYISAGVLTHNYVLRCVQKADTPLSPQNAPAAEYEAYPQLGTIFLWRITRQTPNEWAAAKFNMLFDRNSESIRWNTVAVEDNEWIRKASLLPEVRIFDWFAMNRTRAASFVQDGRHIVEFYDMRYSLRPDSLQSLWYARVIFDSAGNLEDVEYAHHHRGRDFKKAIKQTWRDIWTPTSN